MQRSASQLLIIRVRRNSPMKISKLLMAVDGSEPSLKAANYAIELADKEKAGLAILHVLDMPYGGSVSSLKEWHTELRKEAEKWPARIKDKTERKGVEVTVEIAEHGVSTYLSIADYAAKERVDMIVIGSRGRTGLKWLLLGSVATGVVTYATCPVLVVR